MPEGDVVYTFLLSFLYFAALGHITAVHTIYAHKQEPTGERWFPNHLPLHLGSCEGGSWSHRPLLLKGAL